MFFIKWRKYVHELQRVLLLCMVTFIGCAIDPDDEEMEDSEQQAEYSGVAAATYTYHLPFFSGDKYTASTYTANPPHNAWDFNKYGTSGDEDRGEPIIAVADGKVITSVSNCDCPNNSSKGYGNYVVIDNDGDTNTVWYAHMTTVYVVAGQWVQRGQTLGTIGETGSASASHIHFEVRNSSNTAITQSCKFKYDKDGKPVTATLTNGSSYTSSNHGIIAEARDRNGGEATVGSATGDLAGRVASEGYAKYYDGGSYGDCAIYYQALGCRNGDYCTTYNNSNNAWLVRTGFYVYYYGCGGPMYCPLGFPTSDEFAISGGAKQTFDHGYLIYSTSTGKVTPYYN